MKIVIFSFLCLLCSCQTEDANLILINITHTVKAEKLVFEAKNYLNATGSPYWVSEVKYYISNFTLEGTDGSIHSIDRVQYCDAKDPKTCMFNLGSIPPGQYTTLSFIFGLDNSKNRQGGLANTLLNSNMIWPIPGEVGYHYMKLEGKYRSLKSNTVQNFNLHTGATNNIQNFIQIKLNLPTRQINSRNCKINLEMDIDEWLHDPINYDFEQFGQGIMSNQLAQEYLRKNGQDVFSLVSIHEM